MTVPIPEIDRLVAELTDQDKVDEAPAVIDAGEAVKEEMTGTELGAAGVMTVTGADWALVFPAGSNAATVYTYEVTGARAGSE